MGLTVEEWDRQFQRQANWTRNIRSRLYRQAELWRVDSVLDVGCGTGIITEEVTRSTGGQVIGLDLDVAMVEYAAHRIPDVQWVVGDAHCLPFAAKTFDLVLCNFLLLWVERPAVTVEEMARVVRDGGAVLATTEPDYGGRVDFPEGVTLGPLMEDSLRREGAHPRIGRRLKGLFSAAGLEVEVGVIPSMWDDRQLRDEFESEWDFIFETLNNVAHETQLSRYRQRAWKALEEGERVVFMPNFWALGRKPGQRPP